MPRPAGASWCPEGGRPAGVWFGPRKRKRCPLCGALVRLVEVAGVLVVERHWAVPGGDARQNEQ